MIASLVDTLDWVEEMREDLQATVVRRRGRFLDEAKCGTPGNYQQHLRLGIPPCGSCRQAEALRNFDQRMKHATKITARRRRWYADNKDAINRRKREWRQGR